MQNKQNTKAKVIVIAIAILLCLALVVGITGAFYQARRRATGTVKMDKGIVIDYTGFGKDTDGIWVRENETTFRLFEDSDVQPGEKISLNDAGIRANASSVDFYARVKLSYEFYNGETPVEFAESTKLIKTSSSFFGTNWVESGDGYYYYAAGSTLNKFEKGTQTFVDLFATDAKFIIEGAGFTGATSDGEGGGFVVGDTSINKIVVYLTLETLQGDADAAAEGWKITEVVKPIEIDVATEEKPDINIDDIISDDKKDGEITISGNPTAMKTILIGSRAFEGCTNLRLKLNNSTNITYIIASDAFSEGAQIWYGSSEATNLLINADTTGKTAGQANAWVVAEPNLKVFLPTGVTQNSTDTSYGKYQYTDDQGTWYFDLIDSSGNTVTLSSNNNMSVSTLSASTYANSNTYTAKLRKFVPKTGVTTVVTPKFIGISQDSDKYAVTELYYTFQNCRGLTSITIPGSVTSIGISTFENCTNLKSIIIPDSVTSIGNYAFMGCSGLTSITIPDSVTSIGEGAFWMCSGLTTITIPDSVTSIGSQAFNGCSGLQSINVDSKNPEYHSAGNCLIATKSKTLIAGCKNSEIPSDGSVTYIRDNAFNGCSGLTSITIPDSVTSIGAQAFMDCSGLTSITIPNSVTSIGDSAFSGCELTSINIGAGINEVSWLSSNASGMTITISENNPYLATDSKAIFAKSNGELSLSKYISANTIYEIPATLNGLSVTSIGEYAFDSCWDLTSITIPDSVTSIGNYAFNYCSRLKSITIPDSVTSIGISAFYCCSLTSITIPDSVTTIGDDAFENCSSLTSVVIKGNITSIPAYCFYGCSSLKSIVLPSSITTIEDGAFSGCSKLTTIYVDSADATAITTTLGFELDKEGKKYNENGIEDANGKYYKYSGAIA